MAINNAIVRLNVGGKVFQTTSQTLRKEPRSFLARFCEVDGMQPSIKDDSGAFFVDRDPRYFRIILNYLRSDVVDLEDSLDALLAEADFYCLSGLAKRLEDMRGNSLRESACSTFKTVRVITHQDTGHALYWDPSQTKFVSSHTDVLASIMDLIEVSGRYRDRVKSVDGQVSVVGYKFEKEQACSILGKCGFVLRWMNEKSANDVEFFFSSA